MIEKLLSHHAVDITPRTEWGDRSVIFSRPENKHEPPVRGLDTHSQSVIQEGTSKDTSMSITVCEEDTKMPSQDVRRKPVCEAAMLDEV